MEQAVANAFVSFAIDQLVEQLKQLKQEAEFAVVEELKETVIWELRMMDAVLEHAESSQGPSTFLRELDEKKFHAALAAENIIEAFIITSAHASRRAFFKRHLFYAKDLLHRRQAGKELTRIKLMICEMFKFQINKDFTISDITRKRDSNQNTAKKILFQIMNIEFVPVYRQIESLRKYLSRLQQYADAKNMEDLNEREKIWVASTSELAHRVEDDVQQVLLLENKAVFQRPYFMFNKMIAQAKAKRKMKKIESKFAKAIQRKQIYDIEIYTDQEHLQEAESSIISNLKKRTPSVIASTSLLSLPQSCMHPLSLLLLLQSCMYRLSFLVQNLNETTVDSIEEELKLMEALIKEFDPSLEESDQRLKVWVEEMEGLAKDAKTTIQRYRRNRCLNRIEVAKEIDCIKTRISDIYRRKMTYGIGGIRGTNGRCSTVQNPQGTGEGTPDTFSCDQTRSITLNHENWRGDNAIWFTNGLEEQIKSLRRELSLMHALLEDFEAIKKHDKRLKIWLERIRGIAHEAEDVIKTYEESCKKQKHGILTLIFPERARRILENKFEGKIQSIMDKILYASERRLALGIDIRRNSMIQSLHQKESALINVEDTSIIGFENDAQAIIARLLTDDEHCCTISIVGEEGGDNSTLANLIYKADEVINCFPCRAWVTVGQDDNVREVLQKLQTQVMGYLDQKGAEIKEETSKILNALEERYLIVLDNISTIEIWDSLKDEFPDTSRGSRILVTCQDMAVACHADSSISPHKIQSLSDEECWILFTSTIKADVPADMEALGRAIVRICGSSRQKIIDMGNLLSTKETTPEVWSKLLKQMYEELPLYLIKCLYYFRLFPEGIKIPARRLITLWVAEGLAKMDDEPPEYVAKRYLNELIDQSLVEVIDRKLDGDVKSCLPSKATTMFLQDHMDATSKSSSSNPRTLHFADHLNKEHASYKHIHYKDNSLGHCYKDVLSFLSFDLGQGSKPGEEVGDFIRRCISSRCFLLLRVLDLEGVFRPKLPDAIGKLVQMRYLGLRWTFLENLPPSLSNLFKLQTLDVKHTYISALPHSIWKMDRLRHLYLSESFRSRFLHRPRHGPLSELQTLWGVFIDEDT